MHGLDPMPPRREVISWMPDPRDGQRRIYELECGHFVSRRTRGDKRTACCPECIQ